jgi:hypothetical protein
MKREWSRATTTFGRTDALGVPDAGPDEVAVARGRESPPTTVSSSTVSRIVRPPDIPTPLALARRIKGDVAFRHGVDVCD